MAERPILFSGPMVRAILEGRKSMTRRVMENQPSESPVVGKFQVGQSTLYRRSLPFKMVATWGDQCCVCPYGVPGDRLWVRETTAIWPGQGIVYTADDDAAHYELKKRPAIFMPRADCRLVLEVTAVRVERLQEIDEADAEAEGCERRGPNDQHGDERNYVEGYRELWDSLNAKRAPWASNPWVWVVDFRRSA